MLAIHQFRENHFLHKTSYSGFHCNFKLKVNLRSYPFHIEISLDGSSEYQNDRLLFLGLSNTAPEFFFLIGNYLTRLTYHPCYHFFYVIIAVEKPYLFFSKIKNEKVRDSFISSKSLYMDVRTTENQETKFSKGIHYEKPNTINPIFIGN